MEIVELDGERDAKITNWGLGFTLANVGVVLDLGSKIQQPHVAGWWNSVDSSEQG